MQPIIVAAGGGGSSDRDTGNGRMGNPDAKGLLHPRATLKDLINMVSKEDKDAGEVMNRAEENNFFFGRSGAASRNQSCL